MTKTRVLFLSANTSWGGSEAAWFRLARDASRHGCEAIVVARQYDENASPLAMLRAAGARVFDIERDFAGILAAERPHVVHANLGQPMALLEQCEAVIAAGVPLVVVEHLLSDDYTLSAADRDGQRKIESYRRAARIVYLSERNRRTLAPWAPAERTCVIPYGIDTARFEPAPFRERRPIRAICVARLAMRHKGLDTLAETAALVAGDAEIDLIGDGPARAELIALDSPLRVLGPVDDVARVLREYDAFISLSRYEAKPAAIAEALATGLPCVVSDVGGQPELVQDGARGFVVPPNDAHAAADRLRTLARDARTRAAMRENALAYAKRELDWRDTADAMYRLYQECAAGRGSRHAPDRGAIERALEGQPVDELKIDGGRVVCSLSLSPSHWPEREAIRASAGAAIAAIDGVTDVEVRVAIRVRTRDTQQPRRDVQRSIAIVGAPPALIVDTAKLLRQRGLRIGLADLDLSAPAAGAAESHPPVNSDERIVPVDRDGIAYVAFARFIPVARLARLPQRALHGMVTQFLSLIVWPELDLLLIGVPREHVAPVRASAVLELEPSADATALAAQIAGAP